MSIDLSKLKAGCIHATNRTKGRVYISGAISGVNDYKENFEQARKKLEHLGYDVIDPSQLDIVLGGAHATHEDYMKVCICLLDICDTIYMLNGWRESRGANREYGYALARDMIIIDEEENDIGRKGE